MNRWEERELERLDSWLEGELEAGEAAEVERLLAASPELAREVERLRAVHVLLAASRIDPRPGFCEETLAALRPAPWQSRTWKAWVRPLLSLGGLAAAAGVLLVWGAEGHGWESGLGDVFRGWFEVGFSALVAALEVTSRSWEGLAFGFREWWVRDPVAATLASASLLVLQGLLLRWGLQARNPARGYSG